MTIRHSFGAKSPGSRSGRVVVMRQTMDSENHPKPMGEAARQDEVLSIVGDDPGRQISSRLCSLSAQSSRSLVFVQSPLRPRHLKPPLLEPRAEPDGSKGWNLGKLRPSANRWHYIVISLVSGPKQQLLTAKGKVIVKPRSIGVWKRIGSGLASRPWRCCGQLGSGSTARRRRALVYVDAPLTFYFPDDECSFQVMSHY